MAASVSSTDRYPLARYEGRPDLTALGNVLVAPVVSGKKRPLHLLLYAMKQGAEMSWIRPLEDQLAVVWRGEVTMGLETLGPGDVFAVEHGAQTTIAARGDADILVFERPAGQIARPQRAGGHVHVRSAETLVWGRDATRPGAAHALLLDASCESCTLWLHASRFPGGYEGTVHSHNEDEIILVTAGTIVLGRAEFGPGAVLAVDANTIYSFSAGEKGVTFLNYRPCSSLYLRHGSDDPGMEERAYMLEAMTNRPETSSPLMA